MVGWTITILLIVHRANDDRASGYVTKKMLLINQLTKHWHNV